MSAVVCGKRASSFFEELPHTPPPASKRARCCGGGASPPAQLPQPASARAAADPGLVAALRRRFPAMSLESIEKALEESGNDLDSAIRSLLDLHLEPAENNVDPIECGSANGLLTNSGIGASVESLPAAENLPSDGSEWVEVLVKEMANASNMDDAKARASRVLEFFEKSVISRIGVEAMQSFQKENTVLKEQLEVLLRENTILKRAVAIQHERQKEYDQKNQELQQLKQLVAQYQEQVRNLELSEHFNTLLGKPNECIGAAVGSAEQYRCATVNNYALTMHLRQAQQGSSMPGRFHPDVF